MNSKIAQLLEWDGVPQLANAKAVSCQMPTEEEIAKMRLQQEQAEREYRRKNFAVAVVELAEKLVTEKGYPVDNAFEIAESFTAKAKTFVAEFKA